MKVFNYIFFGSIVAYTLLLCSCNIKHKCNECDGSGNTQYKCETCKGKGRMICLQCEGKGRYICNRCNGTGDIGLKCESCGGKGYLNCACYDCYGVGCSTCRNTGHIFCYDCSGTGKGKGCPTCLLSEGWIYCECMDGMATCIDCKGKKKYTDKCRKCNGEGMSYN